MTPAEITLQKIRNREKVEAENNEIEKELIKLRNELPFWNIQYSKPDSKIVTRDGRYVAAAKMAELQNRIEDK